MIRHDSPIKKHYSELLSPVGLSYFGDEEVFLRGADFSKAFGLERIAILHEVLPPGRRSSWPHAHSEEEEFIYILDGNPDLWIDGKLYPLAPGDGVGFKPGTGQAHSIIYSTDKEVKYLVVGERSLENDKAFYPLDPNGNESLKSIGKYWENHPRCEIGVESPIPSKKFSFQE